MAGFSPRDKLQVVLLLVCIAPFVALEAVVIAFGSQPFVTSFLSVMGSLGLNQHLFIQWPTPVLTEPPYATTVFYWAAKTGRGTLALVNLISSKLNRWTILVATIPIMKERKCLQVFDSLSRLYRSNLGRSVQAKQAPSA